MRISFVQWICFLMLPCSASGDREHKWKTSACHGWSCYDPASLKHPKLAIAFGSSDDVVLAKKREETYHCGLPAFPAQDVPPDVFGDVAWSEKPFILREDPTLLDLQDKFAKDRLIKDSKKHKLEARVGTSSDIVLNKGEGKEIVKLDEYLESLIHRPRFDGETRLEHPYLFDRHAKLLSLPGYGFPVHEMITSWNETAFTPAATGSIFLVGGAESGVGFHRHTAALHMAIHGSKRWFLYHPEKNPPGGVHGAWPILDWLDKVYVTLGARTAPIECIQEAGDIIYIPEGWYHAVINLSDTVAVSIQRNEVTTKFLDLEFAAKMAKDIRTQAKRLKKLIKMQPDNLEAKFQLFRAFKDSKPDKALGIAHEVIDKDPFFVDIQYELANLVADMVIAGLPAAVQQFNEYFLAWKPYLENNTRNIQANQLLSQYYFLMKDKQMGLEYLRRNIHLQQIGFDRPSMPDFREMLDNAMRA